MERLNSTTVTVEVNTSDHTYSGEFDNMPDAVAWHGELMENLFGTREDDEHVHKGLTGTIDARMRSLGTLIRKRREELRLPALHVRRALGTPGKPAHHHIVQHIEDGDNCTTRNLFKALDALDLEIRLKKRERRS